MALRTSWQDSGATFRVFHSTANDELLNGVKSAVPIQAGGANGVPLNWTLYTSGNADTAKMNITTASGRFSLSLKDGQTPFISGTIGAYYRVAVKTGYRYIVTVDVRQMEGKSAATRSVDIGLGTASNRTSQTDWERVTLTSPTISAGTTYLDLRLSAYTNDVNAVSWGVQFQNMSVIEQPIALPVIQWHELTCDVNAFVCRYGRERFTGRYEVGTAQLRVHNKEGDYSYNDQPDSDAIRPGKLVKVIGNIPGPVFDHPVFYGVVDSLVDSYSLDGRAMTEINLLDASSFLSVQTVATASYSEGVTHTAQVRINNLLIPQTGYQYTRAQSGIFLSYQAVLANGRTIRDECALTAESEGGHWFAERDGYLAFKNREWTQFGSTSALPENVQVQANLLAMSGFDEGAQLPPVDTIPDGPGIVNICVRELQVDWSRDRIINRLTLANAGENAKTYEDYPSQIRYGVFEYSRLDLLNKDVGGSSSSYLDIRANDLMTGWTEPKQRVNSVALTVRPDFYGWAIRTFMGNLVRVWYTNANGWGYVVVTRVQAIEHSISADRWSMRLVLDQPVSWTDWKGFVANGWDGGQWDRDIWDDESDDDVIRGSFWSNGEKWSDPLTKWGL